MSFFFSFVFLQIERERERVYKIGYKEKRSQSLLIFFFSTEFLWRIFPLLRANRLYAIFSTGLKKWLPRVLDILFVFFYPEYLALVPSATNPVQQLFLIIYFRWREGVPTSVLGSQPIIWLLSSSFSCQATRVRYKYLVSTVTHILS